MKRNKLMRSLPFVMVAGFVCTTPMNVLANVSSETKEEAMENYGYVSDETLVPDSINDYKNSFARTASEALPASYSTPDLPSVKNQAPYGTCWAFAAAGCAETNLLKKGYTDVDISELHMAYFAYHSTEDPLGGITDNNLAKYDWIGNGGSERVATNLFADWVGAADESVAQYEDAKTVIEEGLSEELAYEDTYHLENFYYINPQDTDAMKRAIMEYGAVQIGYYAAASDSSEYKDYYSRYNNAYYCNEEKKSNHAVMIVGWIDNYSSAKFQKSPGGSGAWIIRNSWGPTTFQSPMASGFYLSYYDKSIADVAIAYDFGPADNFDHNYQYDGTHETAYYSSDEVMETKAANVFYAKANPDGSEEIAAVSFETGSVNVEYKIDIYSNLRRLEDPESGTLRASQTGSTSFMGMYTVRLDEAVDVIEGESYSVVVTLKVADGNIARIATDADSPEDAIVISESNADKNQSFVYENDSWVDYGLRTDANVRIKAYTNDIDDGNDDSTQTGIFENESGELCYYENGEFCADFTGLTDFKGETYYVVEGYVQVYYTGMVPSGEVWYYISGGIVDYNYTGMANYGEDWYYFTDGRVDYDYTGMAENEYGKWYYENGTVNFGYWGIGTDEEGTWFFQYGRIDYEFTGMQYVGDMWRYIVNGEVITDYTGIAENEYGKWYYENGTVNFGYWGVATDEEGTWFFQYGQIDYNFTGMQHDGYMWRYIVNGEVITDYTGIAENEYGKWYYRNGTLDFDYVGTVYYQGVTYYIEYGMVVSQS